MKELRISVVQYLNTAPLVWSFTHGPLRGKYELSFTVPSQCAEALRSGDADVAIIPAIEYARISNLQILPGLAIASRQSVRSLLLVSKRPIAQVRSIALDRSSRSTQALTKILCDAHWRLSPQFIELPPDLPAMLAQADAALLIGDPALRVALAIEGSAIRGANAEWLSPAAPAGISSTGKLFVYDIVEQWRVMTGLPAVLAIWAARAGVAAPEVVADFLASRDAGLRHLADISQDWSVELGLPAPALERYLFENIDYALSPENLSGLNAFFSHAARLALIPCIPSLQICAPPASRANSGALSSRG